MAFTPAAIDLETTGLHPVDDLILEFAMIVTDRDLNPVADFGTRVIRQSTLAMRTRMNDYVTEMHEASGLMAEVLESTTTLDEVDEEAAQLLRDLGFPADSSAHFRELIILGSSCRLDRYMVELQMPELDRFLHYRMLDISAVDEAVSMWAPALNQFSTHTADHLLDESAHRAHVDVRRTLEQARSIRSAMSNAPTFNMS